jgi:hypothetical protein
LLENPGAISPSDGGGECSLVVLSAELTLRLKSTNSQATTLTDPQYFQVCCWC